MEQHFVRFYSPGTFVAEQSSKPIEKWPVGLALIMVRDIKERHGATPYGFQFITRTREDDELDSKQTASSPMYHLGGKVRTLAEVEADNLPDEHILRSNMRNNGIDRIIVNSNSWKSTQPLGKDDVVLDFTP